MSLKARVSLPFRKKSINPRLSQLGRGFLFGLFFKN